MSQNNSFFAEEHLSSNLGALFERISVGNTLLVIMSNVYFWTSTKHLREVQFVGQDISSPSIGSFVSGHETSISLHTGSLGIRFCGVYAGSGGGHRR